MTEQNEKPTEDKPGPRLNQGQIDAMSSEARNTLVLAGPGTGKTTTLVERVRHLLSNNVEPQNILCMTFNKKAAEEIKSRVKKSVKISTSEMQIGTFHAFAYRLITKDLATEIPIEGDFEIWVKDNERLKKIREFMREAFKLGFYRRMHKNRIDPIEVLSFIDYSRDSCTDPEDALILEEEKGNELGEGHTFIYQKYIDYLEENKFVDYPRMVQLALAALRKKTPAVSALISRFHHILIDEYQDINLSQKQMIDGLLTKQSNMWVVGDDDQAIYGWRGSDISFLLNFEREYAFTERFTLSTNYRSGDLIIRSSSRLAGNLRSRFRKNFSG